MANKMYELLFIMIAAGVGVGTISSYLLIHFLKLETTGLITLTCITLGLAIGLLNYWLTKKVLLKPIDQVINAAQEISRGNFNVNLKKPSSSNQLVVQLYQAILAISSSLQQLDEKSNIDCLTGLPNRNFFNSSLNLALAEVCNSKQDLAVLFLDLDGFKVINDRFGHQVGDQLLRGVGHRLAACIEKENLVARLGGDEFIILLPNIKNNREVAIVARKLLIALRQPWIINGHKLQLSASIGIATYLKEKEDASSLIKKADMAMYQAKQQGKNSYQFYTNQVNKKAFKGLVLENGAI